MQQHWHARTRSRPSSRDLENSGRLLVREALQAVAPLLGMSCIEDVWQVPAALAGQLGHAVQMRVHPWRVRMGKDTVHIQRGGETVELRLLSPDAFGAMTIHIVDTPASRA